MTGHLIPRGTSLSLSQLESIMNRGADVSPAMVYAEVSNVVGRYGKGFPPSNILTLASQTLLRDRIRLLEQDASEAKARIEAALEYAEKLWPLGDSFPRNPVEGNNKFLADGIRRALKVTP